MKKWKDLRHLLAAVAVAITIVTLFEGFFYFRWKMPEEAFFTHLTCSAHNILTVFAVDPGITTFDAIEFLHEAGNAGWHRVLTAVYCVGLVIAPFCTAIGIAALIKRPLLILRGLRNRRKKDYVLICGQGWYKDRLLQYYPRENYQLRMIEGGILSEEQRNYYDQNGIRVYSSNSEKEMAKALNRIKPENAELIILCYDETAENLFVLRKIVNRLVKAGNVAQKPDIYLFCEDLLMREMISAYYQKLTGEKNADKRPDLYFVDANKIAVQKMYESYPIFSWNDKYLNDPALTDTAFTSPAFDAHIGIVGFGVFGQKALLSGIQQAVFAPDSLIVFDVFDHAMEKVFPCFAKIFSGKMYEHIQKGDGILSPLYQIIIEANEDSPFDTDGQVLLRFWNVDIATLEFTRMFTHCASDPAIEKLPFTYLIFAATDNETMIRAIYETHRILKVVRMEEGGKERKEEHVPFVMQSKGNTDSIIQAAADMGIPLSAVDDFEGIFSLQAIKNEEIVAGAIKFHSLYSFFSERLSKLNDPDFQKNVWDEFRNYYRSKGRHEWSNITVFDRESSMAQFLHQQVKEWIAEIHCMKSFLTLSSKERDYYSSVEHRRWNLFMITHGFSYKKNTGKEKKSDLKLLKLHDCLRNFERLKQETPGAIPYDGVPYLFLREEGNIKR